MIYLVNYAIMPLLNSKPPLPKAVLKVNSIATKKCFIYTQTSRKKKKFTQSANYSKIRRLYSIDICG